MHAWVGLGLELKRTLLVQAANAGRAVACRCTRRLPATKTLCLPTCCLQARAARKATADAYLSAVSAAAARQDIQFLLQQLSTAAAAAPASGSTQQQQQHMPWLLPAGLTVAARQLANGPGGRPQFAQALVELVLDQGIVEPQRAQRAVHAVLQAYYGAGDYSGVSSRAIQQAASKGP